MKLLAPVLILLPILCQAESWWTLEGRLGTAFHFGSTLEIEQLNQPLLSIDAEYETNPFEDAWYYGLRGGWRNQNGGWEIEFLHHKVYLKNNPPEVQHFEVSHGYNMLMANRVWNLGSFDLRAGVGIVFSNTESTVRGLTGNFGQELSGYTGQASISKNLYLSESVYFGIESKLTFARAKVSIVNGEADVPNVAIHVLAGLGYDFK